MEMSPFCLIKTSYIKILQKAQTTLKASDFT
jgi:hypothetical protein